MAYYGNVKYDGILKDEWRELHVMGSLTEKAKADLAIYHKDGKMGVMHITHGEFHDDGYYFCEGFVPCEYDEISFLDTAEGTYLFVTKDEKQGIIALSAVEDGAYTHVFYNELFPCIYDAIRYRSGYSAYFLLNEGEMVYKYNFLTKEITFEMMK